ncbi:MAG TPA: NAD(P)-binding domain-containing protein, partial [Polyangiales bacterium]|nr:NAD(P)-binding domain-containing protein [Polyangiales bacterium]
MIAFLGMGLLGSNFVRALRRRGEEVQVWNRSPERALALADVATRVCDEPAQAVRGATRIHLTLSDDAAVDDVLERAQPDLSKGAILIDHTTTSPSGTRARAQHWAARGIAFQHAPVFMGPQNALDATGVMLASGDRARFDALAPELSKMTGKLQYVGAEPERAAAFKLLGNSFLMFMTAGLTDMFALGNAFDIAPQEAATLFSFFNPGAAMAVRVERLLSAKYD